MRHNPAFASWKTSSQVTTRSLEGIAAVRQLSSVVLPGVVPHQVKRPVAALRVQPQRYANGTSREVGLPLLASAVQDPRVRDALE